ncbi:hypothetical protein [Hydrogenimonas sp. SS33]|uniref:hypothetical protein n=1 Tax=Hydrogenimonas leucolamina TaxID=2954236 RepID=UPI00336BEBF1
MTTETEMVESQEVDETKREFMKKFGKYAATAPVGMYLLMGPGASRAQASGSTCHADGTVYWGATKLGSYVADGTPNGNCHIEVETQYYGHIHIEIENHQKVKIFKNNQLVTDKLTVDYVKKHLKNWPIYDVFKEIGVIS